MQAIAEIDEKSYEASLKPEHINLIGCHEGHHNITVAPNNSGFHNISNADTTSSLNHSFEGVGEFFSLSFYPAVPK